MNKLVLGLLVTVLVMAVPGLATPIVISNPGFDADPLAKGATQPLWQIGYTSGGNPLRTCTEGCIANWAVAGSVDWVSNAVWQPHNGNWSIDLNGNTVGVLTLNLGVQAAGTYDLSFWMSKNYAKTTAAELALKVTGMDVPVNFSFSGANTATDMMWVQKFQNGTVWGGGVMQITFESLNTLSAELSTGPVIDDITFTRRDEQGVPEPGTLWTLLTGAGLLGLGVKLRRK